MQIWCNLSYGDGKELSCELTVDAVSRLLLDTPIPYYAALNLDGIAALTVRLYGVTGKAMRLFAENNTVTLSELKLYTR